MQKLINTKLVRKIVRAIAGDNIYGQSYTDINVTNNDLRNVTFFVYEHKAQELAKEIEAMLFIAGYKNKVKVTTSKYNETVRGGGNTYLRINNCVLG